MLSTAAKPYIDASVPVLREHGLAITTVFYRNMLNAHPELNNLFNQGNQANGSQQQSLASAVFAYAANIENAAALTPVIERIVHKHVSIGILPSHYPIVGKYLLGAIKDVLKEAATTELIAAWDEAYWLLAGELIAAESRIYQLTSSHSHQWIKMKVTQKSHLSDEVVSVTLKPIENIKLPKFKPGQYLSIATYLEDINLRQIRQYSLSDSDNGDTYRISVKREKGDEFKPQGMISNWIHQHVRVGSEIDISYPYGTFVPNLIKTNPIGLISAGVGITPMISILKTLETDKSNRKILFAHAARTKANIAHYDEIIKSENSLRNLKLAIYLSENNNDEQNVIQGRMNLNDAVTDDFKQGEFFICGPIGFMNDQWKTLIEIGVNPDNIHREVFGPESLNHLL